MIGNNKHKEAGRDIFMSSVRGIANVAAFAIAFLLTPKAHTASVGWVQDMVRESWGYGWDDMIWFVWGGVVALGLFFVSRMTVATLIVMGGMAIMTRFMM